MIFTYNLRSDKRPKKAGWAPGNYTCKCCVCSIEFIGYKRASMCADCAYRMEKNDEQKKEE